MKFLVVDDSPTTRRLVTACLRNLGYFDILDAQDGVHALELLNNNKVDLILTDWEMPNMNGLEFTNNIRNNEKTKNIPIVMITTRGEKKDIIEAVKSKINGFIVKPFTPEILNLKLKPIIEKLKDDGRTLHAKKRLSMNIAIQNEYTNQFDGVDSLISLNNSERIDSSKVNLNFKNNNNSKIIINYKLIIEGTKHTVVTDVIDENGKILDSITTTFA